MGLTNFPNGITSFGVPVFGGGNLIPVTLGKTFWVDSAGSAGTFPTLASAYESCVTGRGDVIVMKAGHAETISTNTALALSKSGVSVVGLGQGALRPTITLTGTTAAVTIAVSGANQLFRNFIVTSGVAELVAAFTVSGADCTLDSLVYKETNATFTILSFVTATATGDRLAVRNCTLKSITTSAGNASCIALVAGTDDCIIENNIIEWIGTNNAATCGLHSGGATLRITARNNFIKVTGGNAVTGINMASTTGLFAYNAVAVTKTAVAGSIVISGAYGIENYSTQAVSKNGILDPAATS
jgi:hypothetical protein